MKRSSMRLFVAVALIALPSLALADSITFSTPDITLTESNSVQTGYFNIVVTNSADSNTSGGAGDYGADGQAFSSGSGPGGSASGVTNTNGSDGIENFAAEVVTSGALTFIGGTDQTQANGAINAATYLYAANSTADPTFGATPSSGVSAVSNQDYALFDYATSPPQTNVVAGTPLGLMQVEYSIPANTTGVFALTIITAGVDPGYGSTWSDTANNVDIPLVVNGAITVNAAALTPEPSSFLLLVLGAVGLFGVRRLRNR